MNGTIFKNDVNYGVNISDSQPVGQIIESASEKTPAGYLPCDGRSLLRSDYPDLFKKIGTTYGAEDDEHFNLPTEDDVTSLSITGGEMKGPITFPRSLYSEEAPLDMNNSDIKGLNSLIWNDHCEWGEGLKFPRSSGNTIDELRVSDGKLYLGPTEASQKVIGAVKIADYKTGSLTATSIGQQFGIELGSFASDVTESNVIGFTVIYWTGIKFIADGDWAKKAGSSGLKCALTALTTGTGSAWVRCTYVV